MRLDDLCLFRSVVERPWFHILSYTNACLGCLAGISDGAILVIENVRLG